MPGYRSPYFPTDQREGWTVVGLLFVSRGWGFPAMVFRLMEEAGCSCEELQAYSARYPGCRRFAAGSHYDLPELLSLLPNRVLQISLDVVGYLVASCCCDRWLGHARTSCQMPCILHLELLLWRVG